MGTFKARQILSLVIVLPVMIFLLFITTGCGKPKSELETATKAAKKAPKDVKSQINLAKEQVKAKEYNEAWIVLKQARALAPEDPELLAQIALVGLHLGDSARVIEDARKAVALAPNMALAHQALGLNLASLEQYNEALVEFEKTLQLEPTNYDALKNRIQVYEVLTQWDKANVAAEVAVDRLPNDATLRHAYARTLLKQDNNQAAEIQLREAIRLDDKNSQAMIQLADLLLSKEDKTEDGKIAEEALKFAKMAGEIDASDGTPAVIEALALEKIGKKQDALQVFARAADANPTNYRLFYAFAEFLYRNGEKKNATWALIQARKYQPRINLPPKEAEKMINYWKKLRQSGEMRVLTDADWKAALQGGTPQTAPKADGKGQ